MGKEKIDNYDDFDYDADFARDYDQEYDDYEAFKRVQPEVIEEEVEEELPKKEVETKKTFSSSYERMREQINKEVEAMDDYNGTSYSHNNSNRGSVSVLGSIFNIFVWFCVAVAIILFIYFIISSQVVTAFLYVIALVVAFFLGYGLMYIFDKFIAE